MAYIQLALDQLQHGAREDSAFLETQRVADWLLAFWGSVDDRVADVERRDLLKVGKYSERLDLLIRLDFPEYAVEALLLSHTKRVEALLEKPVLEELRQMTEPGLPQNRTRLLKLVNLLH